VNSTPHNPYRKISILLLCIGLVFLLVQTIDYINFTVDDVFISLRIAKNAAAGNGFVYNPGELVEGHSDPLWVAALALGLKSGIISSESPMAVLWAAKILSCLFGFLTIAGLYILIRRLFEASPPAPFYASLAFAALASCGPFVLWSCGALEMTLVACCYVFAAVIAIPLLRNTTKHESRSLLGIALLFAIASLSRPEPPLFAAVTMLYLFIKSGKKLRVIAWCGIPYLLIMGAFLLWRWQTYHELVPNTFYAKTGGGLMASILAVKSSLGALAAMCGSLAVFLPFAFHDNGKIRSVRALLIFFIAAAVLFTIYSGGDWMPGFRFYIPVAAMMITIGIIGIRSVFVRMDLEAEIPKRIIRVSLVVMILAASNMMLMRNLLRSEIGGMPTGFAGLPGQSVGDHVEVAQWLEHYTSGPITVALGEAGIIGFLNPNMRLIDMNGLMDKKIAADRKAGRPFDADYIFNRKPDLIMIYIPKGHIPSPADNPQADYNFKILNNPHLKNEYQLAAQLTSFDIYNRKDTPQFNARP
jgi:arabinofuranosyltransferase